jgi:hypothetical protein
LSKIRTAVVIDDLDECKDNVGQPVSAILSLLGRYINSMDSVKFFITGRSEPPIRSGFRLPLLLSHIGVFLLHDVEQTSVDGNIELYLRTRLSQIVAERSHWNLTVLWPGDEEIKLTIKICSGLFIVAYVLIKHVSRRLYDPEERLKAIWVRVFSKVDRGSMNIRQRPRPLGIRGYEQG